MLLTLQSINCWFLAGLIMPKLMNSFAAILQSMFNPSTATGIGKTLAPTLTNQVLPLFGAVVTGQADPTMLMSYGYDLLNGFLLDGMDSLFFGPSGFGSLAAGAGLPNIAGSGAGGP